MDTRSLWDPWQELRRLQGVPLPPGLDLDRAEARVSRGVLTVRFPRTAAQPGTRRIPVRT